MNLKDNLKLMAILMLWHMPLFTQHRVKKQTFI